MIKHWAGLQKRAEIEYVVVGGGRPHGSLLCIDDRRQPREFSRGAGQSCT
jgi:hypothetical protein